MTQINSIYEIETDSQKREPTCGCQGGGAWRRVEWEVGVSRYKLLYTEWKNNPVQLHSTENYIQYPMINHNGKEYKKECITCITE